MNILRKVLPAVVTTFPVDQRLKVISALSNLLQILFKLKPGEEERWQKKYRLDTAKGSGTSAALMWTLDTLIQTPINFKVRVDDEKVKQAISCNKGVLLIGYHGELMKLIIPYLAGIGVKVVSLGIRENEQIWGMRFNNEIPMTPTSLLKVRDRLTKGETVAAMVDINDHEPKRKMEIDTIFGKMNISNAVFKVAANLNCEVIFLKYKAQNNTVVFELGTPSTNKCYQTITSDYINFLQYYH